MIRSIMLLLVFLLSSTSLKAATLIFKNPTQDSFAVFAKNWPVMTLVDVGETLELGGPHWVLVEGLEVHWLTDAQAKLFKHNPDIRDFPYKTADPDVVGTSPIYDIDDDIVGLGQTKTISIIRGHSQMLKERSHYDAGTRKQVTACYNIRDYNFQLNMGDIVLRNAEGFKRDFRYVFKQTEQEVSCYWGPSHPPLGDERVLFDRTPK